MSHSSPPLQKPREINTTVSRTSVFGSETVWGCNNNNTCYLCRNKACLPRSSEWLAKIKAWIPPTGSLCLLVQTAPRPMVLCSYRKPKTGWTLGRESKTEAKTLGAAGQGPVHYRLLHGKGTDFWRESRKGQFLKQMPPSDPVIHFPLETLPSFPC